MYIILVPRKIGKILKIEHVPELYTEYISDNMKELVRAHNPEYLTSHKLDYLKLWIELGLEYPDIYLDAYVAQTRGYYSPSEIKDSTGIRCGIKVEYSTSLYNQTQKEQNGK